MPLTFEIFNCPNPECRAVATEAIRRTNEWLPSHVELRVAFAFADLGEDSLLGISTVPQVHKMGKQKFPSAVAKAITGRELNPGKNDINILINSSRLDEFYTGLDGIVPLNKVDMLTAMLHEIQHGLLQCSRFTGIRHYKRGPWKGLPYLKGRGRWDDFLAFETTDGRYCALRKLRFRPRALQAAITSNRVWLCKSDGMPLAKIHAPAEYREASSLVHLDYQTYFGTEDCLMIPYLNFGEVMHFMGPLLTEIHGALRNLEEKGAPKLPWWQWVSPATDNEGPQNLLSLLRCFKKKPLPTNAHRSESKDVPRGILGIDYCEF